MRAHFNKITAIAVVLLVAVHAPVALGQVGENLVVGSSHTADSDFEAGSIENGSIEGAGDEASVVFNSGPNKTISGFEDGDTTIDTAGWNGWSGDVSADSTAINGSFSGSHTTNGDDVHVSADAGSNASRSIQFKVNIPEDTGSNIDRTEFTILKSPEVDFSEVVSLQFQNSDRDVFVDSDTSANLGDHGPVTWSPGTTYKAEFLIFENNTIRVKLNGDVIAEGVTTGDEADWRYIEIYSNTFSSGESLTVRYDDFKRVDTTTGGTYTSSVHDVSNVQEAFANLSTTDSEYSLNWQYNDGNGWQTAKTTTGSSSGNITTATDTSADKWRLKLNYKPKDLGSRSELKLHDEGILYENDAPVVDNSSASLSGEDVVNTQSPSLSVDVSDPQSGTVQGENITVEAYVDGSKISEETVSSNTTVSFEAQGLANGSHTWSVDVTDDSGAVASSSVYNFEVAHYDPVLSNFTPAGGSDLTELPKELSVTLNDSDFAVGEDSVDLVFYHRSGDESYSQAGMVSGIESNGTYSVDIQDFDSGSNYWYVAAEDSYNNEVESDEKEFSVPGSLGIYNETSPGGLLDNANATVEFYFDRDGEPNQVYQRDAPGGKINMTGLPANEPFVVVVSADGYYNRRIFVPSLYETQRIYLLNDESNAVQPTYSLVDYTGDYALESTVLEVQRSINGSWHTVEGDFFGAANEMTAQLAFNVRHRLVITNIETGESRNLGVFTPSKTGMVTLEVHQETDEINREDAPLVDFSTDVASLPAAPGSELSVDIDANNVELSSYTFSGVANGTELFNVSGSQAGGSVLEATVDLSGRAGQDLTLYLNWTAQDGTIGSVPYKITIVEDYDNQMTLLQALSGFGGSEDGGSGVTHMLTVMASILAMAYTAQYASTEAAGLAALLVMTGAVYVGWFPVTWLFGGTVVWLVTTGMRRRL